MRIICHGLKEEDFSVEFTDRKIFIGRDESNSIVVSGDGISRFHSVLIEDGDELFIQDNDSLNGTFLNYNQVRGRQKLVQGDIIQIGYRLIKADFRSEQDIVLDFIPPEQTEMVSQSSAKPPLKVAAPEPERMMVSQDDIERTMVVSETMLSRSSKPDKSLLPGGSEIGKYVIIKRLGKGGMGEVYLAKHKTLGICRALKLLSKDSGDNDTRFLERFIREAKLASEIRHPNVVGVMDVETDSDCGFPYIVMEYVDGGSLRNSLTASVRLSEEQSVVIVEAIASALQAAEEHNIVHRDIKPDNIMFTRRGEVKLADLGIAKVDGKDTDLTKTNMMIGTPAYLPPEQAQNAKGVDARADIYSLGATFYEMLTGQQPYPGENSIEVLHKLFLTPVPDPRKLNPAVSAASAAIVMKMMAKDPKDRFQNATELLAMLEKTFPPHTAQESAELIRKVIAGECRDNTSFSSNISSSALSLWWLKLPHKGFVLSATGLVIACCIVGILFLFLGKKPANTSVPGGAPAENTAFTVETLTDASQSQVGAEAPPVETAADTATNVEPESDTGTGTGTAPARQATNTGNTTPFGTVGRELSANASGSQSAVGKKEYRIMIKTTPDARIEFRSPDGQDQWQVKVDQAYNGTTVKTPGKYSVTISKDYCQPITRVIDVNEDVTLDLPLKPGGPLVVTTDKDVINANDDVNSLREAFSYARTFENGDPRIVFADDYEIKLSSPLTVARGLTIDGEGHNVTIIAPDNDLMFRQKNGNSLHLKNVTLMSDYSGGILDPDFGDVYLTSVKDGGKAKYLWSTPVYSLTLDRNAHLHRIRTSTGGGYSSVNIPAGTVMEDLVFENNGNETEPRWMDNRKYLVYGLLKDATLQESRVFVYKGGTCENLSVRNGLIEHYDGVTINGLNIGIGTLYGYEQNAVLTGTVTVGGMVLEPVGRSDDHSIVGSKTDLVFDLEDRTEETAFDVDGSSVEGTKYDYAVPHCDYLIQNMKAFTGAHSYTVRVRQNQTPGIYKLAGNAAGFSTKVSLAVSDAVFSKALSIGKPFSAGNKTYTLSLAEGNMLTLTIRRTSTDDRTNAAGSGAAAVRTDPGGNEKLQGALYLLTNQVSNRGSLLSSGGKVNSCFDVLKKFTLGSWTSSANAKGETYYPDLEQSFKRQIAPSLSYFFQGTVSWEKGAELFDCRDTIKDAGWVAVYSGYVVAPLTGKFRFLGYCDDMMVVRFNRQIVIDYGNRSLTTGLPLLPDHGLTLHSIDTGERVDSGTDSLYNILTGNPATKEEKRLLNDSPLYSKNKIEFPAEPSFGYGFVASPELSVLKGQVVPIDILIGELHRENFNMYLLVEWRDSNTRKSIHLFRTTSDMPGKEEDPENRLNEFNSDAPIWKVVDSRGNPVPAKRAQK